MEHPSQDFDAEKEPLDSATVESASDAECKKGSASALDAALISDFPLFLPITAEEIGLLRAFLSEEINTLLRDEV
ncbi:hypothetical protein ACIQWS_01260 [Phyllobacterium sp. NPDC097923]|uniref:hypothetical protein n=1 Tax=Phyllobacterium sp. NPDC097923 TaxID=3364404 RepID=UPI00383AF99E